MVAVICTSAFRRAVHGSDRRSAAIVDTTGAASAAPLMGISLGQGVAGPAKRLASRRTRRRRRLPRPPTRPETDVSVGELNATLPPYAWLRSPAPRPTRRPRRTRTRCARPASSDAYSARAKQASAHQVFRPSPCYIGYAREDYRNHGRRSRCGRRPSRPGFAQSASRSRNRVTVRRKLRVGTTTSGAGQAIRLRPVGAYAAPPVEGQASRPAPQRDGRSGRRRALTPGVCSCRFEPPAASVRVRSGVAPWSAG